MNSLPPLSQTAARGSDVQAGFISRIHNYKTVSLAEGKQGTELFHQTKESKGREKKNYKVEFPLVVVRGGGWLGYKRRPVGVSDCKVDSIIYSAMVNIPSASRHGQFLDV